MTRDDLRPRRRLEAEGWTSHTLRRAVQDGSLTRIRRGIYGPASELSATDDHVRRVLATVETHRSDSVVSHVSAAVLHGLPVRGPALETVHITRADGGQGKRTGDVRLHRAPLPEDEVVVLQGVRVTSLERTLCDLARTERFEWAVAATDAGLRVGGSLRTMTGQLEASPRRPGNASLRAVIDFADGRAESPAESISRVSLQRAGLPAPELQFEVIDPDVGWVATSDFCWVEERVVGEVDGAGKYADDPHTGRSGVDKIMREKERDERIRDAGWWPVHWDWRTAHDHRVLGERIRAAFRHQRRRAA